MILILIKGSLNRKIINNKNIGSVTISLVIFTKKRVGSDFTLLLTPSMDINN